MSFASLPDQGLRAWLEIAYFISGIVLTLGVVFAAFQVKAYKRDMALRARRALAEKAIEYSTRYASFVLNHREYVRDCQANNLAAFNEDIKVFKFSDLSSACQTITLQKHRLDSYVKAFNELEAISMAFVCGIADDDLGFKCFGDAFCSVVELNYDVFCMRDTDTANAHAQYTRELYFAWKGRLKEKGIAHQVTALTGLLNSIPRASRFASIEQKY